jgi:hypothetical protein
LTDGNRNDKIKPPVKRRQHCWRATRQEIIGTTKHGFASMTKTVIEVFYQQKPELEKMCLLSMPKKLMPKTPKTGK